jgi:hypothetical protein
MIELRCWTKARRRSDTRVFAGGALRWGSAAGRLVLEWAIFLAAALWITWPLAAQWTNSLPLGCEDEPAVALLNLWTQWWNVDRIYHFYSDYWRAPIFYPAASAFVFSEPQPVSGIGAWLLYPLLPSPEAVYNSLLWIHLALNGWSTFLMFRSWRCSWIGAVAAGLMVEWMPVLHWQLGIVQLVPIWGVVLTLMFLLRFSRRPTALTGLGCGISAAVTYLLCSYYGLMLGVLIIATLPFLVRRRLLHAGHLRWVAAACLVAALAAGPVIWEQWQATRNSQAIPPRELVAELSAHPLHFLRTPWPQWVAIPGIEAPDRASPWAFSPGTAKLFLAALGVWEGIRRKRHRRRTLFWVALFGVSGALAMGPTLALAGYGPHDFLVAVCPGYAQLRNIHRFATFAQLSLVVLAGLGLEYLLKCVALHAARLPRVAGASLRLAGALVVVLVLLEALPSAPRIFPSPVDPPAWVAFIQKQSRPSDVVAVFPMPEDNTLVQYRPTTLAMYWQMRHRRRMLNGYSGLVPREFLEREASLRSFPTPGTLAELLRSGVDLVVVPPELVPDLLRIAQTEPFRDAVQQEHLDGSGGVFRLRQSPH